MRPWALSSSMELHTSPPRKARSNASIKRSNVSLGNSIPLSREFHSKHSSIGSHGKESIQLTLSAVTTNLVPPQEVGNHAQSHEETQAALVQKQAEVAKERNLRIAEGLQTNADRMVERSIRKGSSKYQYRLSLLPLLKCCTTDDSN